VVQALPSPQRFCQLGPTRNGQMFALDSQAPSYRRSRPADSFCQPLGSSHQRRLAGDDDFASFNFSPTLFLITSVSEKPAPHFANHQRSRRPSEPAKVSNVGKVRDQHRVQGLVVKCALQLLQPAPMVHIRSLTREGRIPSAYDACSTNSVCIAPVALGRLHQ
jgi:hypothetical protein